MKGSALRRLAERTPPPVYFLAFLLAGWGLGRFRPFALGLDGLPERLVPGGALMTLAATLGAWALYLFRRARTSPLPFGTPRALLTGGPYRWSRNPLYVALAAVLAGFAALLDNGWLLVAVAPLVLALDRLIVPGEERRLRELFGASYLAYCNRVRRWI